MKKKILIKFFSVFFVLALANSSITLAKVKQKNVEQTDEKKLSLKEQKEKDIKTIKKVLKKYESLEEEVQQELFKKYKNFKKEDFEVKDYDLEVFFKSGAPILVYTHKKTGAQVFFNLFLKKEMAQFYTNSLIFRVNYKDDKGLLHFVENCVARPFTKSFEENSTKKAKVSGKNENNFSNFYITKKSLNFVFNSALNDYDKKTETKYVQNLAKELKKPSIFEKGEKTFEVEKKRILNEAKDFKDNDDFRIDRSRIFKIREYNFSGEPLEIKNVNLKDLENFYKENIHPSNCLLTKVVVDLNPKKIKNYLNLWHENYFKYYNKKETKSNNFELKNKKKYLFNNWAKDSEVFLSKTSKTNKYYANVKFLEDVFNAKQKEVFSLSFEPFRKELEKLFKSLGYEKESNLFKGNLTLYGDEKKNFEQKTLEKNYKKIINFVLQKLKNLNEEDFLLSKYQHFKYHDASKINKLKTDDSYLWAHPNIYKGTALVHFVESSFLETKKAISNKFFVINSKNEIESSYKLTDENIKKSLKGNLNVYKQIAEKGPEFIDVFKRDDKKTLKQMFEKEKYEITPRVLPIKFKEKEPKKFVKDFAIILLAKFLDEELGEKKGLIYNKLNPSVWLENNFLFEFMLNKESVKDLENYIFKNFNEIMKNFKLKESNLNEVKEQYKQKFNFYKKNFENYLKTTEGRLVKDLKNYIKTGKIDEKSELKKELTIEQFYMFYPNFLIFEVDEFLFTFFDDFKDFKEFFEREMAFKEKYKKRLKEKITPEFVQDFLKTLLEPAILKIKKAYEKSKEKLKVLEKIKLSDVEALIKTAYLVEDKKEIEKVNQNYVEIKKRFENLNM